MRGSEHAVTDNSHWVPGEVTDVFEACGPAPSGTQAETERSCTSTPLYDCMTWTDITLPLYKFVEPAAALLQPRTAADLLQICPPLLHCGTDDRTAVVSAETVSVVVQAERDNPHISRRMTSQACASDTNRRTWLQLRGGVGHLEQPSIED